MGVYKNELPQKQPCNGIDTTCKLLIIPNKKQC